MRAETKFMNKYEGFASLPRLPPPGSDQPEHLPSRQIKTGLTKARGVGIGALLINTYFTLPEINRFSNGTSEFNH